MIGRVNTGGGGSPNKSTIIVTAPTGSTVTCKMGSITKTATEKNGVWTFGGLDLGTWTITSTKGGDSATQDVAITRLTVEYVTIIYRTTPDFTYTGDYEVVDDSDNPISDFANWKNNWKIRFLTSGTFTVTNLNGWDGRLDVFLVGGGGDGKTGSTYWAGSSGGGGYTTTAKNLTVQINTPYEIIVGASGGTSSGFNKSAAGGKQGGGAAHNDTTRGGAGGSGGTPAFHNRGEYEGQNLLGGTDGGNSGGFSFSHEEVGGTVTCAPGIGQGTTTREFGEDGGKLYSSGGNAYGHSSPTVANSGNGGSGSSVKPSSGNPAIAATKGSSGIVVIRNKR